MSASTSSSLVPRSKRRWIASASIAIEAEAVSVSIARTTLCPTSAAAASALAKVPETRAERWSEKIRSQAPELLVAGEKVARRRLRGRGEDARGAQPLVELRRADVDSVAQALVAEADVERHDAPVREAVGGVGQVGRRVEDDRRVLGGEPQPATAAACRMAADDLVELLVLHEAGDRSRLDERLSLGVVRGSGQGDDRDTGHVLHHLRGRLDAVHARHR
jgi:hypothetical protein